MKIVQNYFYLIPLAILSFVVSSRLGIPVIGDEVIYFIRGLDDMTFSSFLPWGNGIAKQFGHPPLYQFALLSIRSIFGESVYLLRVFGLLSTILFFFSVYKFLEKESKILALWAMLMLIFNQALFLQSTFIQADTLSLGLGVLGWYFYREKRASLYFFFMMSSIFIRESSLAFVLPVLLSSFYFDKEEKEFQKKIITYSLICLFSYGLFVFILKMSSGNAFPHHAFNTFLNNGNSFFSISNDKFQNLKTIYTEFIYFNSPFPFILILLSPLSFLPFINNKLNVLRKFYIYALGLVLIVFLSATYIMGDKFFFAYKYTAMWAKLLLFVPFFFLFPVAKIQKSFQWPFIYFSTLILYLSFLFLYNDYSPKDTFPLCFLTLFLTVHFISIRIKNIKNLAFFCLLFLSFQSLWMRFPYNAVTFTADIKTYEGVVSKILTLENSLIEIAHDDRKNNIFGNSIFLEIMLNEKNGWTLGKYYKQVDSPEQADYFLTTNFELFDKTYSVIGSLEREGKINNILSLEHHSYYFNVLKRGSSNE